jgi:DNA-directed RNA polymerase specialized sigma24 family protein
MSSDALAALERDWSVRARRPHAAVVLRILLELEPDLAATGAASFTELLGYVTDPPAGAPVQHWRVTAALLRRLELDDLVPLAVLVALQPGLVAVARALDWGRGGPWPGREAFTADLLSTAWDVLRSVGGSTLAFPERTVLRRIRQRLAWQRQALRRRAERERPVADLELAEAADPDAARRPGWRPRTPGEATADLRLATLPVLDALSIALHEVSAGQLGRDDLAIVYAHRVLGYSLREIAVRSRLATTTVRLRCRRAEQLLCAPPA